MARPEHKPDSLDDAATGKHSATYHHGDLRRVLLESAVALLAESGLDGFSLREVSRRAGVSPAAPAHHFQDVRGLLSAVAADGFRELLQELIRRKRGSKGSPAEAVAAISRGYLAFARAHPAQFALMFRCRTLDMSEPELAAAAAAAFEVLHVTVAAAKGGVQRPNTFAVSDVVYTWSLVHGFAHLLTEHQFDRFAGDRPLEAFLAELFEQVLMRSQVGTG